MKDNIDFAILIAGTIFVLAQLAHAWWRKRNPPRMILSHDSEAFRKIDDIHDALSQQDQIAEGVQMVKTLAEMSATQAAMVDVLKSVSQSVERSSVVIKELLIEFRARK